MATGELGASAHRKIDIEAWMPGRGLWGEVRRVSTAFVAASAELDVNVGDLGFQLHGLSITSTEHTLSGPAAAFV